MRHKLRFFFFFFFEWVLLCIILALNNGFFVNGFFYMVALDWLPMVGIVYLYSYKQQNDP